MRKQFFKGINKDSKFIREEVFIKEQGFKNEFDDYDTYVDTLVIYNEDNLPIATGRVYIIDKMNKVFKLGRIAVIKDYRKKHIGILVVEELEKKAIELGAKSFYISAQVRAVPFYEKCGYEKYGNTYFDEHVEHITMKKNV